MKTFLARRLITAAFAGFLLAALSGEASAQLSASQLGVRQRDVAASGVLMPIAFQDGSRPRWIKWGLIGAAAGAVTFGVASRASTEDPNPLLPDVALGAVVGFVAIGGAIALYDFVCKPDSRSARAGLC